MESIAVDVDSYLREGRLQQRRLRPGPDRRLGDNVPSMRSAADRARTAGRRDQPYVQFERFKASCKATRGISR